MTKWNVEDLRYERRKPRQVSRERLRNEPGIKEKSKRIAEACKRKLKNEKNPIRRHILSVIGEEFNLLYMQL